MSKELYWMIIWPDSEVIRRNNPDMFRKYYHKCTVVVDCTEFMETPSSSEVALASSSRFYKLVKS